MAIEKKALKEIISKMVVTREGKRLGLVGDITFEARTGELIQIILKDPTPYTRNLNLEKTTKGEVLVPYNSIIAIGDFVVISEEDLI
jgi:sporulation protein YlmC with PRC-barrel domain